MQKSKYGTKDYNTLISEFDLEDIEPLKIEVDKFYKTRDGRKAWITECTDINGAFPFRVATQKEWNTYVVTKEGRRYFENTDETDLVAPWED